MASRMRDSPSPNSRGNVFLWIGMAWLAAIWLVGIARAHGIEPVESDPPDGAVLEESPGKVTVWFAEELIEGSGLRVLAEDGSQVDLGDGGLDLNDPQHATMVTSLPQTLPDGRYTVRWKAVLLDGDSSEGIITFIVGEPATGEDLVSVGLIAGTWNRLGEIKPATWMKATLLALAIAWGVGIWRSAARGA